MAKINDILNLCACACCLYCAFDVEQRFHTVSFRLLFDSKAFVYKFKGKSPEFVDLHVAVPRQEMEKAIPGHPTSTSEHQCSRTIENSYISKDMLIQRVSVNCVMRW